MNATLVVARFNESIAWLREVPKEFTKLTVVDMGHMNGHMDDRPFETLKIKDAGRESFAYASWIIANYSILPEWIIFCQGTPFDHMDGGMGFLQWLRLLPEATRAPNIDIIMSGKERFAAMDERLPMMSRLLARSPLVPYELDPLDGGQFLARHPMMTLWTWLFGPGIGTPYENWPYCWGNQFTVRRELILSKPLKFWTHLASCLEHAPKPLEACAMERMWLSILKKGT